jgi:hypothetical protein
VKLLPILESNGRGRDVDRDVAVWIDEETEEVEDGARILYDSDVVVADELLESSCLAYIPIRGFGAGRRSYTSSRSKMLDPCTFACTVWQKNSKAHSRANIRFRACDHGGLLTPRWLRQLNDVLCRHAC